MTAIGLRTYKVLDFEAILEFEVHNEKVCSSARHDLKSLNLKPELNYLTGITRYCDLKGDKMHNLGHKYEFSRKHGFDHTDTFRRRY